MFAFDPVETGEYELILYETADWPGIRYERLSVDQDQSLDELVISPGKSTVRLRVVDQNGQGMGGAQVTVGKSVGISGTMSSVYTYRRGVTDADGLYVAEGLVDGEYTVVASSHDVEGGDTFKLGVNETKDITLKTQAIQLHR